MLRTLESLYQSLFTTPPRTLREDFCGTFLYASEWVRRGRNRRAYGLDINPRPLQFGAAEHLPKLSRGERQRLTILERNVLEASGVRADLIAACNFSFYVLKERAHLLQYCRAARKALNRRGLFVLEMVGGGGFEEAPFVERRTVEYARGPRRGERWFTYSWHQRSFNPITREGLYTISFSFPDGTRMRDTFSYDWRVWTLPEVRECLREAGFDEVKVFWEDEDAHRRDLGTWSARENVESDPTWLCYIAGVKR